MVQLPVLRVVWKRRSRTELGRGLACLYYYYLRRQRAMARR